MFTGLVETKGRVHEIVLQSPGCLLQIDSGDLASDAKLGDSICVNGCCLTVVNIDGPILAFEAGEETLSRTNLGRLRENSPVNLERSLKVGDRLGGHYVTGHVDTVATLFKREDDPPWAKLWFKVPTSIAYQMASKGSVAVDGVSLTLVDVTNELFSVALIPHTLAATTLGNLAENDPVNIETDVLAKYVQRQLQFAIDNPSHQKPSADRLSADS